MNISEITKNVFYVGVNDRTTARFEAMWPLPNGVSYNSYIVRGDKIALIDTVHASQCFKFIDNISSIIGDAKIDYLVINHMEPDHSGAIQAIRMHFPDITIVGNAKTADMIKGYYGITDNILIVKDGDTLDLGGKSLKFFLTPMIHWPETMMTYCVEDGALFSGDAFGSFGALNGGIVDSEVDFNFYVPEIYRYYSNIVAKYGMMVQKALVRLSALPLKFICSTHGVVWHEKIAEIVGIYDKLSKYEAERGVVIAYASMYGNTEELAEAIAREFAAKGTKNVKVYNLSTTDLSFVLAEICRYKGLVVGGPTYCNCLFPPVESLMIALKERDLKNRVFASFGSFTWAGTVTKNIASYTDSMKIQVVGDAFDVKQSPDADAFAKCRAIADAVIDAL
jgi:anaerobic nitric oxide reductase flavorubredoxin